MNNVMAHRSSSDRAGGPDGPEPAAQSQPKALIPCAVNHAETAHLDTPKERALRNDYDDADFEVRHLKAKLKHVRMVPLSEEAEAMFYWRKRAKRAEEMLRKYGLLARFEEGVA